MPTFGTAGDGGTNIRSAPNRCRNCGAWPLWVRCNPMRLFNLQPDDRDRIIGGLGLGVAIGLGGVTVHLATSPFPVPASAFYGVAGLLVGITLLPEARDLYRRVRAGRWGEHVIQLEPQLFHSEAFVVVHNHGPTDDFNMKLLEVRNIEPEPRVPLTLLPKDRAKDTTTISGNPVAFGVCNYEIERVLEHHGEEEEEKCYFRYEPYAVSPYFESIKVDMPRRAGGWYVNVAFRIRVSSEEHGYSEEAWVQLDVDYKDHETSPFPGWVHMDVQGRHDERPSTDSAEWPNPNADDSKGSHKTRYVEDLWERYGD